MNILQVYNQQRSLFGGEETVVHNIRRVLEKNGHQTSILMRSSRSSERNLITKIDIAFKGIYNPAAYFDMMRVIDERRPDIVHVHSVYPNFSPSILAACRAKRVPVLFHVHCYILTCPNWYHLRDGQTCTRCLGGHEQWCLLNNCRDSIPESAAYAVRSFVARKFGLFQNNVTLFVAVSGFVRERLIAGGFPADQIEVVRNGVAPAPDIPVASGPGEYVAYAGRLSAEKGVDTLIEAASHCGLPVKIAGDGPERERLRASAPSNVEFLGRIDPGALGEFYRRSRFVVAPSRSYEAFPLVVAECMMHGKPAIASRIGALPEMLGDGRGLLVETDNPIAFSESMRRLWDDQRLCAELGSAAKAWAEEHCHEDVFYARLLSVYQRARQLTAVSAQHGQVA